MGGLEVQLLCQREAAGSFYLLFFLLLFVGAMDLDVVVDVFICRSDRSWSIFLFIFFFPKRCLRHSSHVAFRGDTQLRRVIWRLYFWVSCDTLTSFCTSW